MGRKKNIEDIYIDDFSDEDLVDEEEDIDCDSSVVFFDSILSETISTLKDFGLSRSLSKAIEKEADVYRYVSKEYNYIDYENFCKLISDISNIIPCCKKYGLRLKIDLLTQKLLKYPNIARVISNIIVMNIIPKKFLRKHISSLILNFFNSEEPTIYDIYNYYKENIEKHDFIVDKFTVVGNKINESEINEYL